MNTEKERADFEAWCETRHMETGRDNEGDYISLETALSWEAYQAGRAALQSQDMERLQFIADEGCAFDTHVQEDGSCKYRLMWPNYEEWDYQAEWFDSPEEAIDHARLVEENE